MTSVLFVRPNLSQGGADRVTRTLLRALPRDRFTPSLALVSDVGELREGLPNDVPVHILGGGRASLSGGRLARTVEQLRPDVVFSTSGGTNLPTILAVEATGHRCRVGVSERNVLFHGGMTPKRAIATAAKRILYPLADVVTAVSDGVANDLAHELALPRARVQVVYNPVVTDEVSSGARMPCAHRFFANDEVPVLLGVGRLVREKGFDVLLRAFARVRRARRTRLVLLGEGGLRGDLIALAAALGVQDDVDLPGFDTNPFKYMARASVFVLSSRHEGLPGALIQAMACGAPSISTDCPSGPSEIIEHPGTDGLLVPVDDVDALAAAMERVLQDHALRARLIEGGRRAAARFDLSSSLARYMEAIWPGSSTTTAGPPS
ncbi:MAG: glycosyltransferase [Deltaproteobacteria bacterium]|nr:glycosyltransferase [Deltaproteobacteria bacterium]